MKFKFEHLFDAEVNAVVAAMLHPDMAAYLKEHMTVVEAIELRERIEEESRLRRKVYYRPGPVIAKVGPMKVEPAWMAFVEESTYDRSRRELSFRNVPASPKVAALLDNRGTIRFEPAGVGRTRRIAEGELRVKFPLLGRIAERIIHDTAGKILDEEASVLARYLKEHPAAQG